MAASLYKQPGYDPFRDFAPIINAGTSPNIIFVHPSLAVNSVQELIETGRTRKLSYGSAGAGSTPHLTGERLLKLLAKLDITHIPYSSAAPAIQAVAGGQVLIGITAMPPTVELIRTAKIRGVGVTSLARMPSLPDVPTVAESGFAGYEDYTWIGFFAPTGTPKPIVRQLNDQIARILQLPETRKTPRRARFRSDPEHARSVHRVHCNRSEQVGESDQGFGGARRLDAPVSSHRPDLACTRGVWQRVL